MAGTAYRGLLSLTFAAFTLLPLADAWGGEYSVPDSAAAGPAPEQPLPFSHRTHVSAGLDCLFCHTGQAASMTLPGTDTCMTCHAALATDRPAIQSLKTFHESGQPVPWARVYQVMEGVTWTHEPHLAAGLRCEDCHGAVGTMEVMSEVKATRAMATCIACHEASGAPAACVNCHAWPADELLEIE